MVCRFDRQVRCLRGAQLSADLKVLHAVGISTTHLCPCSCVVIEACGVTICNDRALVRASVAMCTVTAMLQEVKVEEAAQFMEHSLPLRFSQ